MLNLVLVVETITISAEIRQTKQNEEREKEGHQLTGGLESVTIIV